jgi:hypothetical protein
MASSSAIILSVRSASASPERYCSRRLSFPRSVNEQPPLPLRSAEIVELLTSQPGHRCGIMPRTWSTAAR